MNESYAYLLVKAVVTLVFVLGLFAAALWAFKRFVGRDGAARPRGLKSSIRVLATFFLGQKRNLTVVEVAGEVLVLGVTPTTITCLARLDNAEAIEEIKKFDSSRKNPLMGLFQ